MLVSTKTVLVTGGQLRHPLPAVTHLLGNRHEAFAGSPPALLSDNGAAEARSGRIVAHSKRILHSQGGLCDPRARRGKLPFDPPREHVSALMKPRTKVALPATPPYDGRVKQVRGQDGSATVRTLTLTENRCQQAPSIQVSPYRFNAKVCQRCGGGDAPLGSRQLTVR